MTKLSKLVSLTDPTQFVVVIGGANIDIHGKSANSLRLRDSNPGTVHLSAGGVARNIAENLARLGVDTRLMTAIGTDNHGQFLKRLCCDANIDMRFVHEVESMPTSTYLSVLDADGDMQVAIADMSIIEQLEISYIESQQHMLQQASLITLDTNLSSDAIAWLADRHGDVPLFVDTVSTSKATRLRPHLAAIHTLKAGSNEAEALTGMPGDSEARLTKLAAELHSQGVGRVFITRGADGVYYSSADARGVSGVGKKSNLVRNAGGAGDAFLAALAFSWLHQFSLQESLRLALAAAELTLMHPATCNPDLSQQALNNLMENECDE